MNKESLERLIVAGTPIWSLLILVGLFIYPVNHYVQCKYGGCDSIGQNLTKVMVPDDPNTRTPLPADTDEIKRKKDITSHQRVALMYSGRLNFLLFVMVYVTLCVVAFAVACYVIANCLKSVTRHVGLWLGVVSVSTMLVGFLLYYNRDLHMRILLPLITSTVTHDLPAAEQLIQLSNSVAFAVALLLTVAACCVLYPRNDPAFPNGLNQISTQMKYLRLILYLGTFMLIVGVLMIRSLYQWSLAFVLRDGEAIKAAEGFFSVLLAAEGGYFTFVLAAVYLPAAFILKHRADQLPGMPQEEEEKEKTLKEFNLSFSFMQSLPRIAAILGPVLAGPVGELLGRLG